MMDPIIVVGPGRCGTSCVAGVLHRLGVFMGERMLGAHPTNPYGHWEDCEFLDLNVAFLKQNLTHSQWAVGVQQLVDRRRARGTPWGWKDPRTCNLLRPYLDFFNDPKFIRCVRDPALIEESVVKAYGGQGWTQADAHAMRVRREQELDRYLPWYKTLEVDFDQLRANREEAVRSLVDFCGLNDVNEDTFQSAVQFIQPTQQPGKIVLSPKKSNGAHSGSDLHSGTGQYRRWVGDPGIYDVVGALQFNVLTLLGMREQHALLDVGCGSLRGGRLAIVYLLPNCYFGIEPESWLIEEGIKHNLGPELIAQKRPTFSSEPAFTLTKFGRKFDYILAQSIFSHAAPQQVKRCLAQACQAMHDRSLFVATYNIGATNYAGTKWVYPGSVHYTQDWLHNAALECGLAAVPLDYFHPTGQSWVVLARRNSAQFLNRAVSAFKARTQSYGSPNRINAN